MGQSKACTLLFRVCKYSLTFVYFMLLCHIIINVYLEFTFFLLSRVFEPLGVTTIMSVLWKYSNSNLSTFQSYEDDQNLTLVQILSWAYNTLRKEILSDIHVAMILQYIVCIYISLSLCHDQYRLCGIKKIGIAFTPTSAKYSLYVKIRFCLMWRIAPAFLCQTSRVVRCSLILQGRYI